MRPYPPLPTLGREDEQQLQKKELEELAETIAKYAKQTHQKFPTGDVVVSAEDLADALHRSPAKVAKALRLLHSDKKSGALRSWATGS